ncbi:hypothetical protein [Bacillus wiedmannii]|uniref:hypothetical protein n=1 Tax=Bacillus wiedmannii TaxID=1890302 RepID=UPI002E1F3A89|nr:hypothetical protein [Bacillus wiedmannii]
MRFKETQLIIQYKLGGLLSIKYHNSPYVMINDVYSNCFKEWEFKMKPRNYWTRAMALEVLKWAIEEKEKLTNEEF